MWFNTSRNSAVLTIWSNFRLVLYSQVTYGLLSTCNWKSYMQDPFSQIQPHIVLSGVKPKNNNRNNICNTCHTKYTVPSSRVFLITSLIFFLELFFPNEITARVYLAHSLKKASLTFALSVIIANSCSNCIMRR